MLSGRTRGYRVKRCPVNRLSVLPCDVCLQCGAKEKNTQACEAFNEKHNHKDLLTAPCECMWASLRTTGSGDPSSGCICNTAGSRVSGSESHSACQNAIYLVWSFLYGCTSREPYLSQTEQWWHRSGFSSWQRSQKRIAEETQAIQSCSRQQQPLLTLDHRLTRWRGRNELWELRVSLDCSCWPASAALCTVPYLQSWCGCIWADPWQSSSGSPAETLLDLHAPAALCRSRTGETM